MFSLFPVVRRRIAGLQSTRRLRFSAMPRTRKKPAAQSVSPPFVAPNGAAVEVLTLAEAAAYLRLSEAEVIELVRAHDLPGRLTGSEWRFLKSAIDQGLSSGAPTPAARKQAQLALAGKCKDDPDLIRICKEAYRQRGQAMRERD